MGNHVTVRQYSEGGPTHYHARVWHRESRRTVTVGSFQTRREAEKAAKDAIATGEYGKDPQDREERDLRKAFQEMRKHPALFRLHMLAPEDREAAVKAFPVRVRSMVFRYVPVEDDPIYALVRTLYPRGAMLREIGELYGFTREYVRQIEEAGAKRIDASGSLASFKHHVLGRDSSLWDDMAEND